MRWQPLPSRSDLFAPAGIYRQRPANKAVIDQVAADLLTGSKDFWMLPIATASMAWIACLWSFCIRIEHQDLQSTELSAT